MTRTRITQEQADELVMESPFEDYLDGEFSVDEDGFIYGLEDGTALLVTWEGDLVHDQGCASPFDMGKAAHAAGLLASPDSDQEFTAYFDSPLTTEIRQAAADSWMAGWHAAAAKVWGLPTA